MMLTDSILIPLWAFLGFLVILSLPKQSETLIGRVVLMTTTGHLLLTAFVIGAFLMGDQPFVESGSFVLFQEDQFTLALSLLLDKISLTFLGTLSALAFLISVYARVYLHREGAYRKFFAVLALFEAGYSVLVLANGRMQSVGPKDEVLGKVLRNTVAASPLKVVNEGGAA